MNQLATWMMRLYPTRWRKRYGDELDALLAESGADARIVADLLKGGIRMQFSTWSFPKLAVVLCLAGVLLCGGLSLLLPNEYMSRATMQITPVQISDDVTNALTLNERIQQIQQTVLSRTSLAAMVQDPRLRLYTEELKTQPLDDVIEDMRRNIGVTIVALPKRIGNRASAFDISFNYYDHYKAQQTVQRLIDRFNEENLAASGKSGQLEEQSSSIVTLDVPSLPRNPIYPNVRMLMFTGLCLGLALAAILRYTRQTPFVMASLSLGLAGAILGYGCYAANLLGTRYQSTATIEWRDGIPGQVGIVANEVLSRTALSLIVMDPHLRLYAEQLKDTPLEDVISEMRKSVGIQVVRLPHGAGIEFSFQYSDRVKAQQTVDAIMKSFVASKVRLYGDHPSPAQLLNGGTNLEVLDTPSLPVAPVKPNRYMIASAGGIAGIGIAAIASLIRRRRNPLPELPLDAVNG